MRHRVTAVSTDGDSTEFQWDSLPDQFDTVATFLDALHSSPELFPTNRLRITSLVEFDED